MLEPCSKLSGFHHTLIISINFVCFNLAPSYIRPITRCSLSVDRSVQSMYRQSQRGDFRVDWIRCCARSERSRLSPQAPAPALRSRRTISTPLWCASAARPCQPICCRRTWKRRKTLTAPRASSPSGTCASSTRGSSTTASRREVRPSLPRSSNACSCRRAQRSTC